MEKVILIVSLFLVLTSCNKNVDFEHIGSYSAPIEFIKTFNGFKIANNNLFTLTEFLHLKELCKEDGMSYDSFLEGFIDIHNLDSNALMAIFKESDVIISRYKIEEIVINSEYTKLDGCEYYMTIAEAVSDGKVYNDSVFIYSIRPKGVYRFNLCP